MKFVKSIEFVRSISKKQVYTAAIGFSVGFAVHELQDQLQTAEVLRAKTLALNSTLKKDAGIPVFVSAAVSEPIQNTFDTFATLKAWKEISLFPMEKSVVDKVFVEPGARVNVGTVLAIMHSNIQELRRQLSETDLLMQRNDFSLVQSLATKNFVSKKELEQKTLALKSQEIRAEIEKIEGNKSVLKSPIKGIVSQINLKARDYVDDPQKHVVTIVDPTRLKAEIFLPQDIVAQMSSKSRIVFSQSAKGKNNEQVGRIESIDPIVDSKTGTVRTIASLEGKMGWIPGIYVKSSIVLSKKNKAVVIPNRALVREGDEMFVYRVDSDEGEKFKSEKVAVKVGLFAKNVVEIIDGVEEFDSIVTRGQGSLSDGAEVRVIDGPTAVDEATGNE